LQKSKSKRNSLKKIYKKDTSSIQNYLWPRLSSLWPKRIENYDHAKTIAILMNTLSRMPTQYLTFKPFWTNYKDKNTSLQWTYNLDIITSEFENKINKKEYSGQIKDYLNQLSCSSECATAQ